MRRARIKVAASVPVRRKTQLETSADVSKQPYAPEPECPSENSAKLKTDAIAADPIPNLELEKEENKVEEPKISEKIVPPVKRRESGEKEKEPAKGEKPLDSDSESSKQDAQPDHCSESPARAETPARIEKSPAPTVEGSPHKSIRSCFTKPTPRLDGGGRVRRNSIQGSGASASESEDDSRRSISTAQGRVRNDSISSMQSLKDTSNTSSVATKLNLGQKRRMVVSESARKLAEARRDFNMKHDKKTPDKSKLTMYDLIYYNPSTNPMKPKPVNPRPAARKLSVCSIIEKDKKEEEADDTSGMPVPQVKIGPNGELIIDEQSLVIDQYKAQENIDRSEIIVDDDYYGNGFYKKRPKSKDWSKWETVKFYKALNIIGTDFLLMQSKFPNRTRQELKLKYKKEERINGNLIEKALQYQEFDTETLEKDLATVEENEKKEVEEAKKMVKKETFTGRKRRRRCKVVNDEISGDAQNANSEKNSGDAQSSDDASRVTITSKITRKRKRRKVLSSEVASEMSDDDSKSSRAPKKPKKTPKSAKQQKKPSGRSKKQKLHMDKESDEFNDTNVAQDPQENNRENLKDVENSEIMDEDIIMESSNKDSNSVAKEENVTVKLNEKSKTGTKLHKKLNDVDVDDEPKEKDVTEKTGEKLEIHTNALNDITDDIANMSNLTPGSLVVLKKDSADEPGKTILQVYIVSDDFDASNPNRKDSLIPIDMSPEELKSVNNCIKDIEPQSF
ncbi:transcription factor TFIIIB component B'' homolog [Copidosoma floridanum]|uniref:transcription factor TFIIIB component B'' homolog n=1 Tax=Copidosoma floridanum TaxID=29053 RepID=UPI0006C94718|nr:transcription factor TFIIIB component B'' homolog [Copidosoma floridanum]